MKRIALAKFCAIIIAVAVFGVLIDPYRDVFAERIETLNGTEGRRETGSDSRIMKSLKTEIRADAIIGQKRGLWVFGDTVMPNPISTTEGRARLVNTSSASGITDIYLSVFRPTPNSSGRLMYETADIAALVAAAHVAGQEVWFATGDAPWPTQSCSPSSSSYQRMQDVVGYNSDVSPDAQFDGVMLDVEPGASFDISTFAPMHECFRGILPPSIKLGSAINAFWQDEVEYPVGGKTKPEYAHIIDLPLDQTVLLGYRDTAGTDNCPTSNGLICLDKDEIAYADSIGKTGLLLVGIESINVVPGQPENVSFFEEGHIALALESRKAADYFSENTSFGGFAIHNYHAMFLNGNTNWPAPETVGFCTLGTNIEVEASGGTAIAGYPTLGAAFAAINSGTHTGTIAIEVCGNTTESGSATLNSGSILPASYSEVVIRPVGAQRVIQGDVLGAIIRLNGADNVTIDGRLNVSGDSRDLTVRNNSTMGATAAIWLSSVAAGNGATNNVVRNLEISAGTDSTASGTIASFGIAMSGTTISTTSNGVDNDNNQFLSNRIVRARYGIMTRGTTTNLNITPVIENNIIGPDSFGADQIAKVGIFVQADTGGIIRGNIVQNVGCLHTQACTGADRVGIGVGNESWSGSPGTITSNTYKVEGNIVRNIIEERNNSSVGITLGTTASGSPTNNVVANNFVLNVRANGQISDQTVGIGISGGHSDVVVNNSIALYGDVDPGASSSASAYGSGIRLPSANGSTHANLTLRNNGIYLDLRSNDPGVRFYAISGREASYSFGTGGQDTNNYFLNPTNAQLRTGGLGSATGLILATEFTTLANWRTAYSTPQDASSIQADPLFVSLTDLHLQALSPMIGQGVPVAGVTDDIDGDPRDVVTPDIGADEFVVVNTPPVAVDDSLSTPQNQALVVAESVLTANDIDTDPLTVTAVSNPTNGTVGLVSGTITFTPDTNFTGIAGFDYTVSDGTATDTGRVTVTVTPPVGQFSWSATEYSFTEDGGFQNLTINRTNGSAGMVDVSFGTAEGTANGENDCAEGVDFEMRPGSVQFLDGETIKTVAVRVCDDADVEPNETFTATLVIANGGGTIGSPSVATVTILDDDAAPFMVDTTNDDSDASAGDGICATVENVCSLRAAVQEANILAGEQTIEFDLPAPGFGVSASIVLLSGTEILINGDTKIIGTGADQLTIDGGTGTNRIFSSEVGVSLELTGMTLTGGNGVGADLSGIGGAVLARGDLTLEAMHLTANSATDCGAVRVDAGTHVIRNTTFSGNTASPGVGGGLCTSSLANLVIENSTFSGNSALVGGGIFYGGTSLLITNSTIFANTASQSGGGLRNEGSNVTLRSSIIAGNIAGTVPEISSSSIITSAGFNLIGDQTGDAPIGGINYDILTDILDRNPRLAQLANYGGPTPTHRPSQTSPVIDQGNSFCTPMTPLCVTTDQRGFARIVDQSAPNAGDGADIGAVEQLAPTAAEVSLSGRVYSGEGTTIRGATIMIYGGSLVEPITVSTGTFGAFAFTGLRAGETYVVTVHSGRYAFDEPVRTVTLNEDFADLEFIAAPQ